MIRELRLVILLVLGSAVTACAQQAPSSTSPKPVWVNLSSGVYHCSGTEHYGTTKQGQYLPEAAAIDSGYRANGGKYCSAALAAQFGDGAGTVPPPPMLLPDSGPPLPSAGLTDCIVTRVKDGDTIDCMGRGAVRLIGIDSPERDQAPYGAMATDGLLALVSLRDTIQLSSDKEPRDRYGRLLAYAWRGGVSVNFLMIRQGWAVGLEYPPNLSYAEWFRAAEALAEQQQRGLWELNGFRCRPSKHRAGLC